MIKGLATQINVVISDIQLETPWSPTMKAIVQRLAEIAWQVDDMEADLAECRD